MPTAARCCVEFRNDKACLLPATSGVPIVNANAAVLPYRRNIRVAAPYEVVVVSPHAESFR